MHKSHSATDVSSNTDSARSMAAIAMETAWCDLRSDWFLRPFVHPALRPLLNHLSLPPRVDSRVLVLGSGEGEIAEALRAGGWSSVGLDIDSARICASRHNYPLCHGVRGNMIQLPFEDETFDAVLSYSSLQYADADATLKEAMRVLAPGGRMALTENLRQSPIPRVFRTLRRPMGFEKDRNQIPQDHVDWSWLKSLESHFSSVELEAHHLLAPLALVVPTLKQAATSGAWTEPGTGLMRVLSKVDQGLCTRAPSLSRYCWFGVALCIK